STLFVRPSNEIVPGRIAVVKVEGEMFVKRVMLDNGTIVLLSENPDFPPVRLEEDTDFSVVGIVRGVYGRDLE
ncbi:MAG: S24 family peptidase, partial [Chlorobi bacterium]|nr:S24 family peptidase [Chlorobiota bacterium]